MKNIKLFYHIYYGLLLTVGFYGVSSIKSLLSDPQRLVIQLSYAQSLGVDFVALITLLILLLTLIRPSQVLRLSSAIFINVLFALVFYLGDGTFHSCHPWLISALFLPFLDQKGENLIRNKKLVRILQTLLLSHYFFSGFQKLFIPFLGLDTAQHVVLNHFFERLESSKGPSLILTNGLFNNFPNLLFIGFVLFVLLQLSSLCAIFNYNYRKWFVYGIVLFHLMTLIFMGISFLLTPIALIILVIYIDPFLFDRNESPSSAAFEKPDN